MSRPTVLDPPKPGNLAITPTPETAQRSVLRTAEGKPCGWTVRSSAVPGDVPERGYLRVGPHRGFASDAGVGTEDSPCPDSGPRTYDRARGDPAPCPHLRVPIHHGPRSQKTVAPHGRIGLHGHTRRDDATTPIVATPETYASGCTAVKNCPPRPLKELATRNLAVLSVIATTTCTGSTESMLLSISTSPRTGYPLTLSEIAAWASS